MKVKRELLVDFLNWMTNNTDIFDIEMVKLYIELEDDLKLSNEQIELLVDTYIENSNL